MRFKNSANTASPILTSVYVSAAAFCLASLLSAPAMASDSGKALINTPGASAPPPSTLKSDVTTHPVTPLKPGAATPTAKPTAKPAYIQYVSRSTLKRGDLYYAVSDSGFVGSYVHGKYKGHCQLSNLDATCQSVMSSTNMARLFKVTAEGISVQMVVSGMAVPAATYPWANAGTSQSAKPAGKYAANAIPTHISHALPSQS